MNPRARTTILIGAALTVTAACGSSGTTATKSTTPTTVGAAKPSFGSSVCDAYLRATNTEQQPSKQATGMLTELAKLRPDASHRAAQRQLIAAFRAVESVWTSTSPTTPEAFMTASRAASATFSAAATAAKLDPCPRPDSTATTTTTSGPTKPKWAFNTVERPTSGDGIWVYFDATCAAGTKVAGVTEPWQENTGAPGVSFAALVPGLTAGQPFTGAAADTAFGAHPDFSGTCA